MNVIEANFDATGKKFAIVVSRFNSFVVESLLEGAVAAKKIAAKGGYDGIIAIGAVIRGGTPHFDFVAGECNKGLAQVAMEYTMPVAFGVITTDTIEQAIDRAGLKVGNKGAEAALSALEMVNVLDKL